MDGYVTKPIKSKAMLAEIERVLRAFPQHHSGLERGQADERGV
jgi:hypothetical protein